MWRDELGEVILEVLLWLQLSMELGPLEQEVRVLPVPNHGLPVAGQCWDWDPPLIKATFLLSQDFPRPTLGTGSPTGASHPHVPPGLTSFVALEDPPPAQELPAQHKPPHPQR